MKRPERVAAVDKIEDQRKPEDFIGLRNRPPVVQTAKGGNLAFDERLCYNNKNNLLEEERE